MKCNDLLKADIINKELKEFERGDREFRVNKKMMRFPSDIYSKVEMRDKIIVGMDTDQLANLSSDFEYWRGVVCYDFEGNVLWQVESAYYIDPDTGKKVICNDNEGGIDRVGYSEKENKIIRSIVQQKIYSDQIERTGCEITDRKRF